MFSFLLIMTCVHGLFIRAVDCEKVDVEFRDWSTNPERRIFLSASYWTEDDRKLYEQDVETYRFFGLDMPPFCGFIFEGNNIVVAGAPEDQAASTLSFFRDESGWNEIVTQKDYFAAVNAQFRHKQKNNPPKKYVNSSFFKEHPWFEKFYFGENVEELDSQSQVLERVVPTKSTHNEIVVALNFQNVEKFVTRNGIKQTIRLRNTFEQKFGMKGLKIQLLDDENNLIEMSS